MNGLLLDANLPRPHALPTQFPVFTSRDFFPGEAEDIALWGFARERQLVIVTKDADFSARAFLEGPPPWVVHLKVGNMRKSALCAFLAQQWPRIEALLATHKLVAVSPEQIVALA